MRKISSSILMVLLVYTAFAQKQTTDKRFAGLDTAFARVLKDMHAAGFAVAVVEKDKVIYANGFGYRDNENKIPATANTLFAIGSCTKAFTASLIGMLGKDGEVDIDKPVRNYLPELKFYNDEMNDKITLRDMMCHRTGLPRHDFSWYYFPSQSRDSIMERLQYMEPSAGLREKWQYNNFMFMLQGMVAEKLTGKSWEQNIREKIFTPLGMDSAALSIDEMTQHKDIAVGYGVRHDSIINKMNYYHIDAMAPAGSINSSVNDMAKWVITWINGGKYKGKEIIPSSYVNDAISAQMVTGSGFPSTEKPDIQFSSYGFGWFLASYKGHYRVEHGGNIDGFSASTCFFPTDSIGIIVLSNQNASGVPSIVRNIIADRMLGLKYFDWETDRKAGEDKLKAASKDAKQAAVVSEKKITSTTHALKDYEGLYTNKGYGTFEIISKNDSLFALPGSHTWWFKHLQYDIFVPVEKDDTGNFDTTENSDPLQFTMSLSGDIESVSINFEPGIKPIVFTKTLKAKAISKEQLQEYEGTYNLAGTEIKVYIKGESTLYLFVTGQPEYELVPVDKDKFSIKILKGFSVQFNKDENKKVTELLAIQPNGTFKATKK